MAEARRRKDPVPRRPERRKDLLPREAASLAAATEAASLQPVLAKPEAASLQPVLAKPEAAQDLPPGADPAKLLKTVHPCLTILKY